MVRGLVGSKKVKTGRTGTKQLTNQELTSQELTTVE